MRMLAKILALAGTAGALVTGTAAPASANHQCPATADYCFLTDELAIPVGTPAAGPFGAGGYTLPGPRLCDSTSGSCTETFVHVPSAAVSSTGTSVFTILVPSFGVVIDNGVPTVYYGLPWAIGDNNLFPLGVTAQASFSLNAVEVTPYTLACSALIREIEEGPVSVTMGRGCTVTVTVSL